MTDSDSQDAKQINAAAQERLDALLETFEASRSRMTGYPGNLVYDYSPLLPFLQYSGNNIGDPFHDSIYASNTHVMEQEVIGEFADLMKLPREQAWGYVTSGGTEGNMYGLYLGREIYPDGIVYFSQDTHYSVVKILRLLKARSIMIKSHPNGEIDYDDLHATVQVNRDVPAIIIANIGTTMKGATDDLDKISDVLSDLAVTDRYIHADAALSGMILPFVEDPQPFGFDAGVDSTSISGHKMIGAPLPCGIALTRKAYVSRIARSIELVGVLDTTLSGSRSAMGPLMLWYAFQRYGAEGFKTVVNNCMSVAEYAEERFNQCGVPAWRNRNSLTIVFPRPPEAIIRKWQIAPSEDIAHIITMPHVTRDLVDALVNDMVKAQASRNV